MVRRAMGAPAERRYLATAMFPEAESEREAVVEEDRGAWLGRDNGLDGGERAGLAGVFEGFDEGGLGADIAQVIGLLEREVVI